VNRVVPIIAAAAACVPAVAPATARGGDATVTFPGGGRSYTPASVRIAPGQSVRWQADGGASFGQHPLRSARSDEAFEQSSGTAYEHGFAQPGIYRFYCDVHGAKTGENTVSGMSGTIIVTTNTPPHADFTITPASAVSGQEVTLDASASSDAEGPITAYDWDLDHDGAYDDATGPVVHHAFQIPPGSAVSYPVGLRVTDGNADAVGPESAVAIRAVSLAAPSQGPPPPAHPPQTGTPQPQPTATAPAAPTIARHTLRVKHRTILVYVDAQERLTGDAVLKVKGRRIARGHGSVDARQPRLRARLTAAGRRILRRRKSTPATLVLTLGDGRGASFRVTGKVKVRR
jgi:plastocyanin